VPQVGLCFLRELLAVDVRLAFDSVAPPPSLPPRDEGGGGRPTTAAHPWAASATPAKSGGGWRAEAAHDSSLQPYRRLHFRLWPVDDLLLEADAATAAARWLPTSLANLWPGSLSSSSSSGSDGDGVYGGGGSTHSAHWFGLWPRAVPHLGHSGAWYR
jgi:hypothetical protein